jgi:hypothetical protein
MDPLFRSEQPLINALTKPIINFDPAIHPYLLRWMIDKWRCLDGFSLTLGLRIERRGSNQGGNQHQTRLHDVTWPVASGAATWCPAAMWSWCSAMRMIMID